MKCRKHPVDATSSVGVCATCLRERLLAVIAAQLHAQKQQQQHYPTTRKSATWNHHHQQQQQLFHPTPHAGTTAGEIIRNRNISMKSSASSNGGGKFSSLVLGLFRSRSAKPDLNPGTISDPTHFCSSSPSWFSRLRKKRIDQTHDEHCCYGDESSGYLSSESSQSWWHTPRRTTLRRGHGKNVSGLAFCLSPLVGAGPKTVPPEMLVGPAKPYLSTATPFRKNRSRKLADFGRYK